MGVGDHYTYICMVSGTRPVALPILPIGAIGSMADDYCSLAKMVFNMVRMGEIGQNGLKLSEWAIVGQFRRKCPEKAKMARNCQNGPKLAEIDLNGQNGPKLDSIADSATPKMARVGENCLKLSECAKIGQNGLK